MGNAESACGCLQKSGRLAVVRLVRTDGKYEEFTKPMEVSVLMRMYPDHVVVLCSSLEGPVGQPKLNKVMIMRPGQQLVVGQWYLLHPIPPHHRKFTMFQAPSTPLPKSLVVPLGPEPAGNDQGIHLARPTKLKKLSAKKVRRLEDFQDLCANLLQPLQPLPSSSIISKMSDYSPSITAYTSSGRATQLPFGNRISEAPYSPLLDSRVGKSQNLDSAEESPRPSFGVSGWKPALDSIPESPAGSVQSFGSDLQSRNATRYHLLVEDR